MNIHVLLSVVILAWLISLVCSVTALVLAIVSPLRRFPLVVGLASVALVLAYLGFGRWTPFMSFPQIGYSWSSGNFQISLRSSWFFLVPLVLGVLALVLGVAIRRSLARARS